jgi:hypothetical protein
MKKTNKPSFATRAKQIMSKYKRAAFDKAEKDAMEQELDALIQEQEAMKQAMGLDAPTEQQMELDTGQAMMEGQMQEPQMFDGGGFMNILNKGMGYIGDAYKFLDTGAGVLPQELYDSEIGSMPYNMGIAPTPSKLKPFSPNISLFRKANPNIVNSAVENAKKVVTDRGIASEMVETLGGKSAAPLKFTMKPSKVSNPGIPTNKQMINGKMYDIDVPNRGTILEPMKQSSKITKEAVGNTLNKVPWKNIDYEAVGGAGLLGAGFLGAGLVGAGIYGASQLPSGERPITRSAMSNNQNVNAYQGWEGKEGLPTTTAPVKPPIPTKSSVAGSGSGSGTKPAVTPKIDTPIARTPIDMLPMQNTQGMVTGYDKNYMGATVGGGFASGVNSKPLIVPSTKKPISVKDSFEGDKLKAKSQSAVDALGGEKKTNEFLPSYISAGATMLGNLGQALMDKKPKNINFARYQPEDIDLTEQRLAAEREADLGRAVGRTTARNTGMNAGQAMSNIISSESGVSRNLSNALLQSRLGEETTNVGERNKAGQINAQTSMREAMMNRGMQDEWQQRQRDYVSGAVQAIPDAMADINRIKAQNKTFAQLDAADRNRLELLKNSTKYNNWDTEEFYNQLVLKGINFGGKQ